jgi:hypothetical protein
MQGHRNANQKPRMLTAIAKAVMGPLSSIDIAVFIPRTPGWLESVRMTVVRSGVVSARTSLGAVMAREGSNAGRRLIPFSRPTS